MKELAVLGAAFLLVALMVGLRLRQSGPSAHFRLLAMLWRAIEGDREAGKRHESLKRHTLPGSKEYFLR